MKNIFNAEFKKKSRLVCFVEDATLYFANSFELLKSVIQAE